VDSDLWRKGKVIKVIPIDEAWQVLKLMAAGF
jgi:hypothetical protein